jgi:hypothetical protein
MKTCIIATYIMNSNNAIIDYQPVCWDNFQSEMHYLFSDDNLTAHKKDSDDYFGIMGNKYFVSDCHSFAIEVKNPIDDAFWVGICYSDVILSCSPKKNGKCIIWSGGDTKNNRPGTVRVYGTAKMYENV